MSQVSSNKPSNRTRSAHFSTIVLISASMALTGGCEGWWEIGRIDDWDGTAPCWLVWEGDHFPEDEYFDAPPRVEPNNASMQPGETQRFEVVRWVCCVVPVGAVNSECVQWSVDPPAAGTIDDQGAFRLAQDAEPGEQITIRATFYFKPEFPADVFVPTLTEATATVTAYTSASDPLVGGWHEVATISCDNGEEVASALGVGELVFRADGHFSVTWTPFEVYRDYWGDYTYDQQTGQVEMTIESGNYIPDLTDLAGFVQVQPDGTIRLDGIFFGHERTHSGTRVDDQDPEPTCGYVIGH